jgi:phosphatidylserine decarboxylase
MTIHKEGYATLLLGFCLIFLVNSAVYYFFPILHFPVVFLSLLLYGFLVSFFRSPARNTLPSLPQGVLSPCDGKVVVIEKVFEPEFLQCECMQVSIFMSPLNVHINWYPVSGKVLYSAYHAGKYLAAWHPKAATENERTTVCQEVSNFKILYRQVAGALARRIVCYAKEGDQGQQGNEMGFIKFGSRVDLYLPLEARIDVSLGQKVSGKITQIASLPE